MNCLSWNVRGLGRPEKRHATRKLVKKNKLVLLLLHETKISENVTSIIFNLWGSQQCGWDWVPLVRASGGLISIWNEDALKVVDVLKSQRRLAVGHLQ